MAELIDRYLEDVMPEKRDARNQGRQLLVWRDKIGDKMIVEVNSALVNQMRDELKKDGTQGDGTRSAATVNRFLAILSHVFTIAINDWQWATENPVKRVSRLKEPKGRVRFLSDEERDALLTACNEIDPTLHLIVVLALSTGARRGEIMNLRWPDVDLPRGLAILQETKNGERRSLPLVGYSLELLKAYREKGVRHLGSDLVFPDARDPSKPFNFRALWYRAIKQAEIANFRFHDLRHTAASYLAMGGATLAEISHVLGHKSLSMVARYAHIADNHASGVVEKMNAKMFGS
jgi:integrase